MKRDLAMAFSRVTEGAALAGYKWLGRGDKNAADGAAVEVMRTLLNKRDISGEIDFRSIQERTAIIPALAALSLLAGILLLRSYFRTRNNSIFFRR